MPGWKFQAFTMENSHSEEQNSSAVAFFFNISVMISLPLRLEEFPALVQFTGGITEQM